MGPRVPSQTSLWKSYGIHQLPGDTVSNYFVRNTHGGGNERIEGMGQYRTRWPFQNQIQGSTLPPGAISGADGKAIQSTGMPYTMMRYDYDQGAVNAQAGYSPVSGPGTPQYAQTPSAAPFPYNQSQGPQAGLRPQDHGSMMASLMPVRRSYHPAAISTQSAASRHRLQQRYMGGGNSDWSDDIRTDAGTIHTQPASDYMYSHAVRESDAMLGQEQQQMWREANVSMLPAAPPYRGARAGFSQSSSFQQGNEKSPSVKGAKVSGSGLEPSFESKNFSLQSKDGDYVITLPKWGFMAAIGVFGLLFVLLLFVILRK